MPVIDAHVHFWDVDRHRYDWLSDEPRLAGRYQIDDYRAATADDPPAGFVFVQAGCADDDGATEARWVHEMCAGAADFAGMVVWAPVASGAEAVDAHLGSLEVDSICGIRRMIQSDPPGLCTQPAFVDGVVEVGRRGLTFDLCLFPRHLADALELVRRAPDTRFVVDHLAKPSIAIGDVASWRPGFVELAAHDNVWCKLSGLVTEADPDRWAASDLAPFVDIALDAFAGRVLWGSDWPVVTLAATHRRWRDATSELLAGLTPTEHAGIMHDHAIDAYQLDTGP